jgi:hypothetical protein
MEGYRETLKRGSFPFVLAEHEKNLEKLGIEAIKAPTIFGRSWTSSRWCITVCPVMQSKPYRKCFPIRNCHSESCAGEPVSEALGNNDS